MDLNKMLISAVILGTSAGAMASEGDLKDMRTPKHEKIEFDVPEPAREMNADARQARAASQNRWRTDGTFTEYQRKDAQRFLANQGYYHGRVDGVIGPKSMAAIKEFQMAKKLQVTGRLNEATISAMKLYSE